MAEFEYHDMFPLGEDTTTYRQLDGEGLVRTADFRWHERAQGRPRALRLLTATAIRDISHLFRTGHLEQLRRILDDVEASPNDHFVAEDLVAERRRVSRDGPALLPGHGYGDRRGQEGSVRVDRARFIDVRIGRRSDQPRSL